MRSRCLAFLCFATLTLSSCAEKAEDVAPQYVSPIAYQSLSCRQIAEEAQRVSDRVSSLTGVQNKKAENDAVATGVAVVLFWPAAFFIKGNSGNAQELAQLKGQMDTIEQVSIRKNCSISFQKTK